MGQHLDKPLLLTSGFPGVLLHVEVLAPEADVRSTDARHPQMTGGPASQRSRLTSELEP
eukprot:CAMPEP_0170607710 /NCGR_PEP_ID=MMETSP0224-20130122/21198_1 /TAXON_ID=285029 /ORGANISM="Togula jolla, Strain CCCM 725" /LENGTH=58 /DNA_ID=CAMNT_0010932891 /DNA_START=267 /DNA_END=439 /DNA_ORIENTATION=+